MADILTACLANEEAMIRELLTGKGQHYIATYGPFPEQVITFSGYEPPDINFKGSYSRAGDKVIVHTRL